MRSGPNSNLTPTNHRFPEERTSATRLKYGYGNSVGNNHENLPSNIANSTPSNTASTQLSATSIKYLKAAQNNNNNNAVFGLNKGSTSTAHSNVLLQAQNLQNRNDSFGMQSNYSNQGGKRQAEKYGSCLIQSLMSPSQTSSVQLNSKMMMMRTLDQ